MPVPGKHNTRFIEIADSVKPELRTTTSKPLGVVTVEKDDSAIMGWAAKSVSEDVVAKALHKGDSIIFDFGKCYCPRQVLTGRGPSRWLLRV
jgi:alpha-L-rhamnosidase